MEGILGSSRIGGVAPTISKVDSEQSRQNDTLKASDIVKPEQVTPIYVMLSCLSCHACLPGGYSTVPNVKHIYFHMFLYGRDKRESINLGETCFCWLFLVVLRTNIRMY